MRAISPMVLCLACAGLFFRTLPALLPCPSVLRADHSKLHVRANGIASSHGPVHRVYAYHLQANLSQHPPTWMKFRPTQRAVPSTGARHRLRSRKPIG